MVLLECWNNGLVYAPGMDDASVHCNGVETGSGDLCNRNLMPEDLRPYLIWKQ
jgi:hypothetical protein